MDADNEHLPEIGHEGKIKINKNNLTFLTISFNLQWR